MFLIIRVSTQPQPPVYFLRDLKDEDIDGIFYEKELAGSAEIMQRQILQSRE